jgi:hypothetical protein
MERGMENPEQLRLEGKAAETDRVILDVLDGYLDGNQITLYYRDKLINITTCEEIEEMARSLRYPVSIHSFHSDHSRTAHRERRSRCSNKSGSDRDAIGLACLSAWYFPRSALFLMVFTLVYLAGAPRSGSKQSAGGCRAVFD